MTGVQTCALPIFDKVGCKVKKIIDLGFSGISALKEHRNNTCELYAVTIQTLSARSGFDLITDMFKQGQWMIVIDEYHHYGIDAVWGKKVMSLNSAYRLTMSATPDRKEDDSAFGKPDIAIRYEKAVDEKAVKPLMGHSYNYRVDAINAEGDIVSYTTAELKEDFGEGEKMEKIRIERKMRWSPKYVSPLVSIPIERMIRNQLKTGHRLQAVVGAMCVSHAEMVCDQIRSMFPELNVEWVGTGTNGKDPKTNSNIIKKFAPPEDKKGQHEIDVLVHVGMAGEGLDSIYVSEVIHLNKASVNNSNNQENGRASRYLKGITGNISFDSSSEYALKNYVGRSIEQAFSHDIVNPSEDSDPSTDPNDDGDDDFQLPDEPIIVLADMELLNVDSGDIKKMQQLLLSNPKINGLITEENKDTPEKIELVADLWRNMRRHEAKAFNEVSTIKQWQESVDKATGQLAHYVLRQTYGKDRSVPKSAIGDIKKLINSKKRLACGPIEPSVEVCMKHWGWLKGFEASIKANGVPSWLA